MTVSETQARIKSRVWQGIAQAKLDLSGVDKETVEALVSVVAEAAMLEVEDILTDTAVATEKAEPADADNDAEDILWEGRPFLSLTTFYTITDERVRIRNGLLGRTYENVELIRVQDLDYSQTFGERLVKVGDITIRSHDPSHPEVVLSNIPDPESVYEILRRAVLDARRRHNFSYREEM